MEYDLIEQFKVSRKSAEKLFESLPNSVKAKYEDGVFDVSDTLDENDIRDFCQAYSEVMADEGDNSALPLVVAGEFGRWALVVTKNDVYDYDLETLASLASKEILREEAERARQSPSMK